MALKLDMSKTYDRVDFDFLKIMIEKMGFDKSWVSLVMRCISIVSYSVNMNGRMGLSFIPEKALRQGDPLSPFLFLICSEGLFALIRAALREDRLNGVKVSQSGPSISHLLFVNDCILFGETSLRDVRTFKEVLQEYKINSGQCFNLEKCLVFFNSNLEEDKHLNLSNSLGVQYTNSLEKYLGLPNMVGRRKKAYFQN